MRFCCAALVTVPLMMTTDVLAAPYRFLTGVDVGRYPDVGRAVLPDGAACCDGTFFDGNRLVGTSAPGDPITFVGLGTPLFPPNHIGAMSYLFRRGSVPAGPGATIPFMAIDFLGGPLLDLDGDLGNGSRSLIPVMGQTPIEIPDTFSFVDLTFDLAGGAATLNNLDATGTNEGAPGIQAETATEVLVDSGTDNNGGPTAKANPAFDMRVGTLTAVSGTSATIDGLYRIDDLPFELWLDSIDPLSSSPNDLGTFQYFARARGWLVIRDCDTGVFPSLAGEGLGSTLWPTVDTSEVGNTFNTANGLAGGTATIIGGVPGDTFSAVGNGGLALPDAGGDIGAYFDSAVIPALTPDVEAFVYLESAGFGINNSFDPVFLDNIGYDLVIIAEATGGAPVLQGDVDGDGTVDVNDAAALVPVLLDPGAFTECELSRANVNGDAAVDGRDIQALIDALI